MYRTNNNKAEYKDFFKSADYLNVDTTDISYITTKVTEESIDKEVLGESIVSIEKIRVDKMLGVYKYLEFKLPEIEKEYETALIENQPYQVLLEKRSHRDWFKKGIKYFKQVLSGILKDNGETFDDKSVKLSDESFLEIDPNLGWNYYDDLDLTLYEEKKKGKSDIKEKKI